MTEKLSERMKMKSDPLLDSHCYMIAEIREVEALESQVERLNKLEGNTEKTILKLQDRAESAEAEVERLKFHLKERCDSELGALKAWKEAEVEINSLSKIFQNEHKAILKAWEIIKLHHLRSSTARSLDRIPDTGKTLEEVEDVLYGTLTERDKT